VLFPVGLHPPKPRPLLPRPRFPPRPRLLPQPLEAILTDDWY
jgi:hypothetical protein